MQDDSSSPSLFAHLESLPDHRIDRQKLHLLVDILVIAICAAISGADGWVAVERFGKLKESWLRRFLKLPNGIPSHDTFGRVFAKLDPNAFREVFISWVSDTTRLCDGEIVAVDGKTLRRSYDTASSKKALHMVNAWASQSGFALGQLATEEKSNEITAIPKLLELLELKGCIVTTDAAGCQKTVVNKIIDKEADYILALKGNQGLFHDEVVTYFDWALGNDPDAPEMWHKETFDTHHGREEIRRYWVTDDVSWFSRRDDWPGLQSFALTQSVRTLGDKKTIENRYFISSLPLAKADAVATGIRTHWGVENSLHWVLDIAFREDECRIRMDNAPENFGIVRQMALNLLKREKTAKVGVATKRLMAGWNDAYLEKVIGLRI